MTRDCRWSAVAEDPHRQRYGCQTADGPHRTTSANRCPPHRPPHFDRSERDAHHQPVEPRPRRVVDAFEEELRLRVFAAQRDVAQPHPASPDHSEHYEPNAPSDRRAHCRATKERKREQREHEVEMFLHAQRPHVAERLPAREVDEEVLGERKELPDGHHLLALANRRYAHVERQHRQVRRQNSPRATRIERAERRATVAK